MANHQQNYSKTYQIIQRCTLDKVPLNLRERSEALGKKINAAADQVTKAMALRLKTAFSDAVAPQDETSGAGLPMVLLMLAGDRLDLKLVSRLLGQEVEYYPQEQIEAVFGSPMNALSVLGLTDRNIRVVADGRVFDQENVVVSSGDPLVELLVSSEDLRAFLGESVSTLDLESAKQQGSTTIQPRTLKGFRDYLPEEMLPRQGMIAAITTVFERFGFAPLQTPALEYSDILLGKLGGDAEKLLFRFKDNGGRDVCLRYDLTVPLARVAAQYPDLAKPFKRYQIAPVWRAENPGRGRFREFFQCDCDIVGSPSLLYDAECIALDFAVMQALGVNVEVRFNNRKVLAALGRSLQISDERQMMTIFRTIDKIPSQGAPRVRELLKTEATCGDEQIEKIMRLVAISGTDTASGANENANEQMLLKLSELLGSVASEGIDELRRVNDYVLEMLPANASRTLKLDFSIARGIDYYTGTVYETFLTDLPNFGSVMSGGRYDKLIERYLGKPMPAVGISVGIDRLFAGLMELGRLKKSAVTTRVAVIPMDAACVKSALKALGQFRQAEVAAEMVLENEQKPKLDKQLSLAGKKGIPFAAIVGSHEAANGTVMLKDLSARQQVEMTVEQAIEKVKLKS